MLTIYRRHKPNCPHREKGRTYQKCPCPIHCDGMVKDVRVRQAMKTSNWARATRRMAEIEEDIAGGRVRKSVEDATVSFMADRVVEPSTKRKYTKIFKKLSEFAANRGLGSVDRIGLEDLDAYRASRKLSALTWSKELQTLRTFFEFCKKRKWCAENTAEDMTMPPEPKPKPREPYTEEEIKAILAACDTFGRTPYERVRARAMILLMKYYGLRISDVATLARERVREGYIFLHALKNGAAIWLPLFPDVDFALQAVPLPREDSADHLYYFWHGVGSKDAYIKVVDQSLKAVFRESGVKGAHAHRFRHTLATEVLVTGGSVEDAANILGDSPAIIRKHYAKWSTSYQTRTVDLFRKIHGTPETQEKKWDSIKLIPNTVVMVAGEGVGKSKRRKPH